MINQIQSSPVQLTATQNPNATSSKSEKYTQAAEVLAQFDSNNLTADDALNIVNAFQEIGLEPNRELAEFMGDSGFNARTIGELATDQPSPPAPPQSAGVNQQNLSLLQSILENFDTIENLNDNEKSQLTSTLEQAGLLEPGALIYTQS